MNWIGTHAEMPSTVWQCNAFRMPNNANHDKNKCHRRHTLSKPYAIAEVLLTFLSKLETIFLLVHSLKPPTHRVHRSENIYGERGKNHNAYNSNRFVYVRVYSTSALIRPIEQFLVLLFILYLLTMQLKLTANIFIKKILSPTWNRNKKKSESIPLECNSLWFH